MNGSVRIFLHIGLPKTATTWWQHEVFPFLPQVEFVHRRTEIDQKVDLIRRLIGYCEKGVGKNHRRFERSIEAFGRVFQIAQSKGHSDVLVSNENISITARGFWNYDNDDAAPKVKIRRLSQLVDALGNPSVKVLLGTREPADWIASRYAKSARNLPQASQQDFNDRIASLLQADELPGSARWLDYEYVQEQLSNTFGTENVLAVPMENLTAEPVETILRVGKFLGGRDLQVLTDQMQKRGVFGRRLNQSQYSEGVWHLRGHESEGRYITLSSEMRNKIRQRFPVTDGTL